MVIGRVYKIVHNQSDIIYIGSTFNSLRNRWYNHCEGVSGCTIRGYIDMYGKEQFKIILIKEYDVADRNGLFAYEQLWINNTKNCINKQCAFNFLSGKRYQLRYQLAYRKANRDKRCKRFICICGGYYTHAHKSDHMKSKKHKQFLTN